MRTAARARVARARDIAAVLAVDRVIFPEIPPMPTEGRAWWLARIGRRVVGFGGSLIAGRAAYLSRAGVVESARGLGLHHALIRARVEHARAKGCRVVLTYTLAENVRSSNNLIAEGFRMYLPDESWFDDDAEVIYWRLPLETT